MLILMKFLTFKFSIFNLFKYCREIDQKRALQEAFKRIDINPEYYTTLKNKDETKL
jgi:hypothetical protein